MFTKKCGNLSKSLNKGQGEGRQQFRIKILPQNMKQKHNNNKKKDSLHC